MNIEDVMTRAHECAHHLANDANWHSLRAAIEAYGAECARAERERCIESLRELTDKSGVNEDGRAWMQRLTRGDCVQALMHLPYRSISSEQSNV